MEEENVAWPSEKNRKRPTGFDGKTLDLEERKRLPWSELTLRNESKVCKRLCYVSNEQI